MRRSYKGPIESLEQGPWRKDLDDQGHASVLEAVKTLDQEDAVDSDTFVESLQEHLNNGRFRLVLVLDEMSAELERIVAYLDAVTLQTLTVDLITVSVYEVNGTEVAMPQRISPDPSAMPSFAMAPATRRAPKGVLSDGPDAFVDSIADIEGEDRALLNRLVEWAMEVVALPGVSLCTYTGVDRRRFTLLPRITTEKVKSRGDRRAYNDLERQPQTVSLDVELGVREASSQVDSRQSNKLLVRGSVKGTRLQVLLQNCSAP